MHCRRPPLEGNRLAGHTPATVMTNNRGREITSDSATVKMPNPTAINISLLNCFIFVLLLANLLPGRSANAPYVCRALYRLGSRAIRRSRPLGLTDSGSTGGTRGNP